MKDFIDNYINSLSAKRRKNIAEILNATTVSKTDIESIATRLADFQRGAPLIIEGESFGTFIDLAPIDSVVRELRLRMSDIFNVSNNVSLVLDSYSSMLISEIKALEDEIISIEKAIENYAFSLSDGGFFDYSFIETFSDETMKELDTTNIKMTDRSGVDFSNDELAIVNSSSGILSLDSSLQFKAKLTGKISKTNFPLKDLLDSETKLQKALNNNKDDGWYESIDVVRPINSSLNQALTTGAQAELELILEESAAPCSNILLSPFSDLPVEILKVTLFESIAESPEDGTVIVSIENENTITLDRPTNISFPMQNVAKFTILVNNSIYTRGNSEGNQDEVTHRIIYESVMNEKKEVEKVKPYKKNKKALMRIFSNSISDMTKEKTKFFKSQVPQLSFEANKGPLTFERMSYLHKVDKNKEKIWNFESKVGHLLRRMIHERIFSDSYQILNDRYIYNLTNFIRQGRTTFDRSSMSLNNQEFPRIEALEPQLNINVLSESAFRDSNTQTYKYDIGIRNIEIGSGIQIYRGVFISKPIPAPGDSTEVKIKVDDQNYRYSYSARDSKILTSIEYSISNKFLPLSEDDWIPILPAGTKKVLSERLFLNSAGFAPLRFAASNENEFIVYKNGYQIGVDKYTLKTNINNLSIRGIEMPINLFTPTDIFTVDYTTYNDETWINLVERGFEQSVLASAHDDVGSGETFNMSGPDRVISLSREPYIDYNLINQFGSYSNTLGFQGNYQPLSIIMSDGTVALNQTNYTGGAQNNLAMFDSTKTAYIHSGKNVIFNKDITEEFTVYYQYLPSNLRFRVIMRINDPIHASPSVNTVQLKTKVKRPNSRSLF